MVCCEQNCVPVCGGAVVAGHPATCGMLGLSANDAAPSPLMFGSPPVALRKLITCAVSICARMIHMAISARVTWSVCWKLVHTSAAPGVVLPELVPAGGGMIGGFPCAEVGHVAVANPCVH